ncbi:glycosyltransferase family 39 protein [Rudanella lutea]|uniref:glycosyltransferase family 39 protein n=1 Tax=Rudanella lutea TaxID=451374 RepID=UPI00037F293E|nr:glycosyltransferase family 39 protein [Rudanella lutea]
MSDLSNRNTFIWLAGILFLAFVLRVHNVGRYGIYFDEKSTLLISQGVCLEGANQKDVFTKKYFTPAEFWKPKTVADFIEANIRGDIGNSPSYYAVLWVWMEIFGLSDLSMRMPSVLFSTLMVAMLFWFVRRHFRSNTLALLAAGIAAIEPFFVAYAQMARNYSMTFFLTLLSTHIFLLILEKAEGRRAERRKEKGEKDHPSLLPSAFSLYLAYGAVFALSVLSHYLAVTVFLCHGIYAIFFLRNVRTWVALAITGAVGLGLVSLWFIFGGGAYTFQTMAYQAEFYRNIALTNPTGTPFGLILPGTIPNITKRAIPIFADLFLFTNGLGSALTGLKNAGLALTLGGLMAFVMHRYERDAQPPIWVKAALPSILLAGTLVYSVVPLRFLVLSIAPVMLWLMSQYILEHTNTREKRYVLLLVLLAFVPTFFLLFMSWRNNHTFGITQRYSGFSFPYVCLLIAMALRQLASLRWWFTAPVAAVLVVQLYFVSQVLIQIYGGVEPKYTYFEKPRIKNPYWFAAQELKAQYTPGDTILYPNMKRVIYSEKIDKTYSPVALLDAQLVNVYLPEDATYIQRVDPNERDKIVLVKGKDGPDGRSRKVTIFDLKDVRY